MVADSTKLFSTISDLFCDRCVRHVRSEFRESDIGDIEVDLVSI